MSIRTGLSSIGKPGASGEALTAAGAFGRRDGEGGMGGFKSS